MNVKYLFFNSTTLTIVIYTLLGLSLILLVVGIAGSLAWCVIHSKRKDSNEKHTECIKSIHSTSIHVSGLDITNSDDKTSSTVDKPNGLTSCCYCCSRLFRSFSNADKLASNTNETDRSKEYINPTHVSNDFAQLQIKSQIKTDYQSVASSEPLSPSVDTPQIQPVFACQVSCEIPFSASFVNINSCQLKSTTVSVSTQHCTSDLSVSSIPPTVKPTSIIYINQETLNLDNDPNEYSLKKDDIRRGSNTSLTLSLSPAIDCRQQFAYNLFELKKSHLFSNRLIVGHGGVGFSEHHATNDDSSSNANNSNSCLTYGSMKHFNGLKSSLGNVSQITSKSGQAYSAPTDYELLRTASLPLSGPIIQQKVYTNSLFKEFWDIPTNFANKNARRLTGCSQKNRYPTILPNIETRVVLPIINNDEQSSFINANYIHGYKGVERAFIATQGPMSHTVNDFWRMIWHANVPVIVMITKIVESGKRKCELYLPNDKCEYKKSSTRANTVPEYPLINDDKSVKHEVNQLHSAVSFPSPSVNDEKGHQEVDISQTCAQIGSEQKFGEINVRVTSVVCKPGYTCRKLLLKKEDEERMVMHFWYVTWPDHSSPESTPEAAHNLINLVNDTEHYRYHLSNNILSCTSVTPSSSHSRRLGQPRRQDAQNENDDEVVISIPDPESAENKNTKSNTNLVCSNCLKSDGESSNLLPCQGGPMVVHCSAGIGRTGCFIALCIGCEQLRNEGEVDVFGIVNRLRLDRGGMVEDHNQYTFLHMALSTFYSLHNGLTPTDFHEIELNIGFDEHIK